MKRYKVDPRIKRLAARHRMTFAELDRMQDVLRFWPRAEHDRGIAEEAENVLAARRLAKLPDLTHADLERCRRDFASGARPSAPQNPE